MGCGGDCRGGGGVVNRGWGLIRPRNKMVNDLSFCKLNFLIILFICK